MTQLATSQPTVTLRTFPVVELFGPTLQGEGPDQGRPAYFVRFGGCDFRCSWCDSMHAVDPVTVRAESRYLAAADIVSELDRLPAGPSLVVLSGGNPALLELGALVDALHTAGREVAVETQGSRWKSWLADVDSLVVSPKGPSSGMDSPQARDALTHFVTSAADSDTSFAFKVVVFDVEDLGYARWMTKTFPAYPMHLSVGTDVGGEDDQTIAATLLRLRWLSESVAADPALHRARVGAQQHVLTWGTRKGV